MSGSYSRLPELQVCVGGSAQQIALGGIIGTFAHHLVRVGNQLSPYILSLWFGTTFKGCRNQFIDTIGFITKVHSDHGKGFRLSLDASSRDQRSIRLTSARGLFDTDWVEGTRTGTRYYFMVLNEHSLGRISKGIINLEGNRGRTVGSSVLQLIKDGGWVEVGWVNVRITGLDGNGSDDIGTRTESLIVKSHVDFTGGDERNCLDYRGFLDVIGMRSAALRKTGRQ